VYVVSDSDKRGTKGARNSAMGAGNSAMGACDSATSVSAIAQ
jgi:hypothetical protein